MRALVTDGGTGVNVSRFFKTDAARSPDNGAVTMNEQTTKQHLSSAAATTTTMLGTISSTDWSAATPCRDWDLGTLAQHVVGTTTGMITIGRREPLDPQNLWSGPEVDPSNWTGVLAGNIEELARAWGDETAWKGTVQVGGETPAAVIGDMAYAEILLHGWDIAGATGTTLEVSPEVGTALLRTVAETAELGRQMGAYGDPVTVDADASDFDQALGLAGRDPSWRR